MIRPQLWVELVWVVRSRERSQRDMARRLWAELVRCGAKVGGEWGH